MTSVYGEKSMPAMKGSLFICQAEPVEAAFGKLSLTMITYCLMTFLVLI
jgi:hypothetical protein